MDKINTQKYNVNVKKSDTKKAEDVLGALFSVPVMADEKKVNGKSGVLYFLYHYIAVAIIKVLSLAISFLFPQFKDDKFFSPNLVMVAQKSLND